MVCSAAQWAKNVVHCTWSARPRYVLSYGQIPLFGGGVERSENPNPTQIQSVLSVTPLFALTLQILYTNELDVLCIRNEIESLRMDVDLTLHGEEGRPPSTRKRVTPTKSYGYGQVPVTQQW
jgi:hypothetical protein